MSEQDENLENILKNLIGEDFSFEDPLGEYFPEKEPLISELNPNIDRSLKNLTVEEFQSMSSEDILALLPKNAAIDLNLPKEKSIDQIISEIDININNLAKLNDELTEDQKELLKIKVRDKLKIKGEGPTLNLSSLHSKIQETNDKKLDPTYYHIVARGFKRIDTSKLYDAMRGHDDEDEDEDNPLNIKSFEDQQEDDQDKRKSKHRKIRDVLGVTGDDDTEEMPVGDFEFVISSQQGVFIPSAVREYICHSRGFSSCVILSVTKMTKDEYEIEMNYKQVDIEKLSLKNEIDDLIRSIGGK